MNTTLYKYYHNTEIRRPFHRDAGYKLRDRTAQARKGQVDLTS